jgi:hypothetical protein
VLHSNSSNEEAAGAKKFDIKNHERSSKPTQDTAINAKKKKKETTKYNSIDATHTNTNNDPTLSTHSK